MKTIRNRLLQKNKKHSILRPVLQKKGFMLIDKLVAIAIFAVVASVLCVFIFQSFTLYYNELDSTADGSAVRGAMTQIVNMMRKTKTENISTENNILHVGSVSFSWDGIHLLKDGNIWMDDIDDFKVTPGTGFINLSIRSTEGRTVETSYALR